jgi:hypothetical protein
MTGETAAARTSSLSRRVTALTALAVTAVVALVAPSTPALASAATAMSNCKVDAGGSHTVVGLEFGTGIGFSHSTPVLHPGDVYRVSYLTGTINDGGWPTSTNWTAAGAGWGQLAPSGGFWPAPGVPKYGLIAAWRGLPGYYWLGANSLCIQVTGGNDAVADFWMNDESTGDNYGYWSLALAVYRA